MEVYGGTQATSRTGHNGLFLDGWLEGDSMSDAKYAPACGIYCGSCRFLGERCKGCGYVDGKPFWTVQIPTGVCPFHDCCRNQRQLEHCGMCDDFPCKMFADIRDPDMSDEEFRNSLDDRLRALKRRTAIGTEEWLIEKTTSRQ